MYRTLRLLLTLTLAALPVASAVAQPRVTTVSGTVQEVNTTTGRLMLRSAAGTLTELQAPAILLTNLQTGEAVEVMMTGPNAMIIRKQSSVPPAQDDTLPQPQPDERRQPQ
jgi:hypothetical protein